MTQWKKLLKSLGFSESESALYLSSLEAGPSTVQDLAKIAKLSRVTTYAVIEALTHQGLMSSVEKGKKKLFVAESPDRLLAHVSNRVKEMEATLKEAEESIQDLKLLQRGEKPVVKLFEGKDALRAVMSDIVATRPETLDEWGNTDEILGVHHRDDMKVWYAEMDKAMPKNHQSRLLLLAKKEPLKVGRTANTEIAALPQDLFDFNGDVLVYANKVALSTFRGKQISVIIESNEIADTVKQLLNYIWALRKNKN
ncbi:MAG: helix-turn-helix domain-containing protein [Candidatus Uhrbacteria bacterium]